LPQATIKNEIIKIYNNNNINNDDSNNTFLMDNDQTLIDTIKLKKVFSKSKKLILEIMTNDTSSEKYTKIEINPFGYINSTRPNKDGITYFGNTSGQGMGIGGGVDIQIKNNENYYEDDGLYGRHFMIKFNPDDLNYYIKDLGRGTGAFIKIQEWTEIKNNSLLNIGENYIVLSFDEEEGVEEFEENNNSKDNGIENYLNIKIFSVSTQIKSYKFFPSDCPITIGRSNENNIFIDDDMLSRIHCTIDFNNDKWYIQDGYAKNGIKEEEMKKSTNGSWIYAYDEIKIIDKMVFKANSNLFICNLV
jgi:pSer/pThr/pTyr-binding forkhead associated (FHA) protein